ncbi:helicase-related protein [Entomobacter blattae]|uniref:Helicase C-terminal domain-containing protein n=1 Tax=Entomobacter blattae TaxID=2762277 RepID=A0A7H1NRY5_9PROT|nr:helicase-related protein [Entomobacter blattae]QNT78545.1 hypothetical protein JGUZn3_13190 [Entomobacter blattae]
MIRLLSLKAFSDSQKKITAILGPTNTGKTHIALERMLAHHSGMIGFPLRLLARENYDRMVKAKGEKKVALITGEEKIIPPQAQWFSCTVEAMPLDQPVEFMAIDEIQLCADPDRGYVFTDRLLHARGFSETLFLGAETIKPFLKRLIPHIHIETRPRLSTLSYTAHNKLSRLPKRSAIVAFSVAELYGIAELIRRRKGGCAIVMGRLSPRTRNAQVGMYQAGEVDYLVATDAIGMGLNMDISHVAFSNIIKFDGTKIRPLIPAEMGQIAGRAGRGMKDGTFGLTGTCPPVSAENVTAIETHLFPPSDHIFWRNHQLDFSSPPALLKSLSQTPPPGYGLILGNHGSDMRVLATLIKEGPPLASITSRGLTQLLWESCQIPDFRKLGEDSHARLCLQVFHFLQNKGHIPAEWLRSHIHALNTTTGDIDTLMGRLTSTRIYAYIAARKGWVKNALHWQEKTREIEDTLSDALHERLTARFVDKRASVLLRTLDADSPPLAAITPKGDVLVEEQRIGKMCGFILKTDQELNAEGRQLMLKAARKALHQEIPYRVNKLLQEDDAAFSLSSPTSTILWHDAPVAMLQKGHDWLHPQLTLLESEYLSSHHRTLIHQRLTLFLHTHIRTGLSVLFSALEATQGKPALRGLTHSLYEHGGWLHKSQAVIPPFFNKRAIKKQLHALGIRIGCHYIFYPKLFSPESQSLRLMLLGLWHSFSPLPTFSPTQSSLHLPEYHQKNAQTIRPLLTVLGWIPAGDYMIRGDKVEDLLSHILYRSTTQRQRMINLKDIASRLAIPLAKTPLVLQSLGCKLILPPPLAPHDYGPIAPVFLRMPKAYSAPKKIPPHASSSKHPYAKKERKIPPTQSANRQGSEKPSQEKPPQSGPPIHSSGKRKKTPFAEKLLQLQKHFSH